LELLEESGVALSKRGIEVNLAESDSEISYTTIKNHINLAEASGLVEIVESEGTWYRITDRGRKYLAGELDVSELEGDDG
jgi:repressor of nif and glnA expression